MRPLIFLNLSNGVVYPGPFDGLVRIQSTWCEQKLWSRIIEDLDYSFLVPLALGRKCVVVDVSAKKAESRAIYQGIPWIKYVLRYWRYRDRPGQGPWPAQVNGHECGTYFWEQLDKLSPEAKLKLKYTEEFNTGLIPLDGLSIVAKIDGDKTKVALRLMEIYGTR